MRIKSSDDAAQQQAYLTRNPKDPLPDPHQGDRIQNGHVKETTLLNDVRGQRLNARSAPRQEDLDEPERQMNGQNHVALPTVIRNDHEMAVKTKVISVKRDIQPSTTNHRATPTLSPTTLHGTAQRQTSVEQSTPRQGVTSPRQEVTSPRHEATSPRQEVTSPRQFNYSNAPTSPQSPTGTSYNFQLGSSDSLDGPSPRLSNGSASSLPYPPLSPPLPSPNYFNVTSPRPGSQMSSYERTLPRDMQRLSNDMSQASVSAAPKFIRDTTSYWYKPDITREQALAILREKPAGCFVVRDSRCFPGAFGLALKVDRLPPAIQPKPGVDLTNEYVRHFLIEMSSKGVRLKGCPNEPVFGSLSALVYQHSITPLALPCKLIIPTEDQEIPPVESQNAQSEAIAAVELLKQGAACNVIYIGSLDTESLTGPMAIENAVARTFAQAQAKPNRTSTVHFKVSPQGITLTDNERKIFFRRHYPTSTVTFCGLDPLGAGNKKQPARRWDATTSRGGPDAWMFGFVARKQTGANDNECHVFAELDSTQPARAIVNFVTKILIGPHRQNSP